MNMRKMMIAIILVAAVVTGAKAQILYRISGNGLDKPSYVIGTYHVAPVSFADSIPGLKAALAGTSQVYGELEMKDFMNPDSVAMMQQAMMLGDGQTLTTLLDERQQAKLNAVLNKLIGADLTSPMLKALFDEIKPGALLMQLSMIMSVKLNPDFDATNTFDGYFQKVAQKDGKPVRGFETMGYQTDVLLKSVTMERQIEQLMCLCDNYEYYEDFSKRMARAFFSQDIEWIKKLFDERLGTSCDATDEENDRLIYNRNRNWLKVMPAIMKQSPTFFAVGVGHIVGEKGILEELRKAGYTVEGVK